MRLVALAVAIGGQIVLARDDVDPHPAASQMVERCRRGSEVRRPPITRPDRNQRLEAGGARGERGRDGERVGTAPAGADERALPAMLFQRLRVAGQRVEAVVVVDGGISAMTCSDVVGNIPEKFGMLAHAMPVYSGLEEGGQGKTGKIIRLPVLPAPEAQNRSAGAGGPDSPAASCLHIHAGTGHACAGSARPDRQSR